MSTIDAVGNLHDTTGRFAEKTTSKPAGLAPAAEGPVYGALRVLAWRAESGELEHGVGPDVHDVIGGFEEAHPDGGNEAIAVYLAHEVALDIDELGGTEAAAERYLSERANGITLLSARLAHGQAGTLVDIERLRSGDRVDLSRVLVEASAPSRFAEAAAEEFLTVDGDPALDLTTGQVLLSFRPTERTGERVHVSLPAGYVIPTRSVSYRGEQLTEREAVQRMHASGHLAADHLYEIRNGVRQRRLDPHEVIARVTATTGNIPTDDHPRPVL